MALIIKSLLTIFIGLILHSCTISRPSRGKKIGRIVKLAREGVFCETMEGELIRGGIVDGSGSMGTSFKFTIEDSETKIIAYEAFENQQEVIVYYECELITGCWRSECTTPHFVKDIEIIR